jgi:hypothetical protein
VPPHRGDENGVLAGVVVARMLRGGAGLDTDISSDGSTSSTRVSPPAARRVPAVRREDSNASALAPNPRGPQKK